MEQLNHYNTAFQERKFPITVVCDAVYFQQNLGSIFRICEAMGVSKIIFSGDQFVFSERKINKTSRNTHKIVPYEIIPDKKQLIELLQENYHTIAVEITKNSIPIENLILNQPLEKPVALIIGNEISGVSEELLSTVNQSVHINMYGQNSSMNVVQALTIGLFAITRKLD